MLTQSHQRHIHAHGERGNKSLFSRERVEISVGKLVKRIVAGAGLRFHGGDERTHLLALEVGLRALAIPDEGATWWVRRGSK